MRRLVRAYAADSPCPSAPPLATYRQRYHHTRLSFHFDRFHGSSLLLGGPEGPEPALGSCCTASERGARTLTASGSDRVARTAIISAKAATILNSRQPGVKAGEPAGEPARSRTSARRGAKADEPATSRTSARQDVQVAPTSSARPENRADLLEVLQRVDAEVKTTLPSSLRRPISLGSAQSATGSRRRTA